jgi:phenylacetic acid degradation operon negative regulatory protein
VRPHVVGDDGAMTDVSLPSRRGGEPLMPQASARSMLLTLVGEMLTDRDDGAWTTALLRVFAGLGIEDFAGRQLLARSAKAGWLTREREGRGVRWRLDRRGRELVEEGVRRSTAYLAADDHWDGRWLMLHVTVPQSQRTTRKRLYGGLGWLGLGNPVPGVWVTPHTERADALARLVGELGLQESAFAIVGEAVDLGMGRVELVDRAWDLADLGATYKRLLAQESTASPPGDPDHLLLSYVDLLNLQQRFMRRDPQLPVELLPEWVGRDAAALFRELRRRWGAGAHRRFWEIVGESAP